MDEDDDGQLFFRICLKGISRWEGFVWKEGEIGENLKGVDLMKICVRGIDCEESRLRSWRDVEELNWIGRFIGEVEWFLENLRILW